jgi:hypothetical protein
MKKDTPDLRVHSLGMASAYGFRPMTAAGRAFVQDFAAKVEGKWSDDSVYWFSDHLASPYQVLEGSSLNVVSGVGVTSEHDRPWPRCGLEYRTGLKHSNKKGE